MTGQPGWRWWLQELGPLVKTLYPLRYIDDEQYRRRILVELNRG